MTRLDSRRASRLGLAKPSVPPFCSAPPLSPRTQSSKSATRSSKSVSPRRRRARSSPAVSRWRRQASRRSSAHSPSKRPTRPTTTKTKSGCRPEPSRPAGFSLWIHAGPHRSRAIGHQNMPVCCWIVVITTTHAPEWTRTITGKTPHKALNLARLPIPPRAQGGEYSPGLWRPWWPP